MQATAILSGIVGSRGYGLAAPESDYDIMSIVIPPPAHYIGLTPWGQGGTQTQESLHGFDGVHCEHTSYEIRKAFKMALGANPNFLPLLYLRDYTIFTAEGRKILENRRIFESKLIAKSFSGYAQNQLKKMGEPGGPAGRMGAARKALRDKYGYDTKYAMHSVRLLSCAEVFLRCPRGGLPVFCSGPVRELLLNIRNGKFSKENIASFVREKQAAVDALVKVADLSDYPDYARAEELLMEILAPRFKYLNESPGGGTG